MPKENQHFGLPGHNFNRHKKFTLIEQLSNTELYREVLTY